MVEFWRDIPGYEGLYQVSSRGRVRSVDRVVVCAGDRRRGPHVRRYRGCTLQPHNSGRTGLQVVLGKKGGTRLVHALVALAFIGPRPEGCDICHNNGDNTDNRPENLRYCTRAENNRDIARHGRRKLTLAQAREIRRRRLSGEKTTALAKEFDINAGCVTHIARGDYYR